jgi:PAS domain S-box-containing protein
MPGQRERLLELIIHNAMDAFVVIDVNNLVVEWTPQAEMLFGWSKEEAIGESLSSLIIPFEHWMHHEAGIKRYIVTGQSKILKKRIEIIAEHKDGHKIPIELTVTPINLAGETFFSASIRDNSERQQYEATLRQQTAKLREQASLLELTSDAIIIRTWSGNITFWNRGAEEMYGYGREEMIGKAAHTLLKTRYPVSLDEIHGKLLTDGRWSGSLIHTTRFGQEVTVLSRWALDRDETGGPSQILIINTNLSGQDTP